ncbi:MAG: MarR family winged helix-turn-helix transcriptional regulator [Capsulimonadaceae bacterium]
MNVGDDDTCPGRPMLLSLIHAGRVAEDRLETALGEVGLSGAKFAALVALAEAGEPISLSELASHLTCVRSNVTQLVDRLEADGLVERIDDPRDRRSVKAALTDLGRTRHSAAATCARGVFDTFESGLDASARTALATLFASLK